MEFVLKQLNAVMTKVVASLPSSFRNQMGDLKEKLNEMILGMYNQMIGGLGDQMCAALMDSLQPAARERKRQGLLQHNKVQVVEDRVALIQTLEMLLVLEILFVMMENLELLQKFQCVMPKV